MSIKMKPSENPDPTGLAIARAVQQALPHARVILFGSRARGDHRPNSDTDLLVVVPNTSNPQHDDGRADSAQRRYRQEHGIKTDCDVIVMTETEFNVCRKATQHIAGQAAGYGVDVSNASNDFDSPWNDAEEYEPDRLDDADEAVADILEATDVPLGYPNHWPATRFRLEAANEWATDLNELVEHNVSVQRTLGMAAQQALENALKGWLSTYNDDRTYGHDFGSLWQDIQRLEDFSAPATREIYHKVQALLDYTSYPDDSHPGGQSNWLEKYAGIYRYRGTPHLMTPEEKLELREKVNAAVAAIVAHVLRISGASPDDLG